jgi:hypothetical protein
MKYVVALKEKNLSRRVVLVHVACLELWNASTFAAG